MRGAPLTPSPASRTRTFRRRSAATAPWAGPRPRRTSRPSRPPTTDRQERFAGRLQPPESNAGTRHASHRWQRPVTARPLRISTARDAGRSCGATAQPRRLHDEPGRSAAADERACGDRDGGHPELVVFIDPTPYSPKGCCTVVRAAPIAGKAHRTVHFGSPGGSKPAHGLVTVGDRAFWLATPGVADSTIPLDPNGRGHRDVTSPARFALPPSTTSIAATAAKVDVYLDAQGISAARAGVGATDSATTRSLHLGESQRTIVDQGGA
ncbi:MAG: hypothetical protein JWN65_2702 [Solirubrobacterales bacterium]|nr:hypothetical protein [Solirubrobacterales bacterium]